MHSSEQWLLATAGDEHGLFAAHLPVDEEGLPARHDLSFQREGDHAGAARADEGRRPMTAASVIWS